MKGCVCMEIVKNSIRKFIIALLLLFAIFNFVVPFYKHSPSINHTDHVILLYDSYDGEAQLTLEDAKRIYENESGYFQVWTFSNVNQVLNALDWIESDLQTEDALFGISRSMADDNYLPQNRAQKNYNYSAVKVNNGTGIHSYIHLYFYTEVELGNGTTEQNVLFIMKEY